MNKYQANPYNRLPNGLTLLQVNPDCAVQLNPGERDFGWLYVRHCQGGEFVTHRKLSPKEIEEAQDQEADMTVLQGAKVRAG